MTFNSPTLNDGSHSVLESIMVLSDGAILIRIVLYYSKPGQAMHQINMLTSITLRRVQ